MCVFVGRDDRGERKDVKEGRTHVVWEGEGKGEVEE